ncbi:alpha-glucuronidase family glycosyl hydrolase [Saliterribacillus persicus]|uniref:Xylan alpha-1,2-glucuronidase n=1 Tax=Saliterribacillus persicus TaxID=930114 RepID=A0A368Y3B0_9BACI|nr:alpha-glucuronidase family glycosyl hydrolase [Saliterribacillus persicus]RCW74790.1 alpha-glucuronidase [Saliterribacillus persicus]
MDLKGYHMWLQYQPIKDKQYKKAIAPFLKNIRSVENSPVLSNAMEELAMGIKGMFNIEVNYNLSTEEGIVIGTTDILEKELGRDVKSSLHEESKEAFEIIKDEKKLFIIGNSVQGALYGAHHFLRSLQLKKTIDQLEIISSPKNDFRMLNQWDNFDGTVERGYSGNSIFFKNDQIVQNKSRIKDYARFLSSVGINAISINNVNVWEKETFLITKKHLAEVKKIAAIFRGYGIKLYLSINFASPMAIDQLASADPLDENVKKWWKDKAKEIYQEIPDFGGFVVKADSEHRPGPFFYNRNHADGANMLAEAVADFGGKIIWRCFVYNCLQDWRDRSTDRARAAYDHFKPLDGDFLDNVILQIKNGPMDFQVREPVSPLIGAMQSTNQLIEFQVAQEYTGQQKDLCYLIPQWKEVLSFDTYHKGEGSTIEEVVAGNIHPYKYSGIVAVSNIGDDENWTGNTLAQANLYGYGRLIWNPSLTSEQIAEEWIIQTFGEEKIVRETILDMLLKSWPTYEKYTAPLGVGWMINPGHHYGPNIDGYEYAAWGTYHFADRDGIGVDRTEKTGTGYAAQYQIENQRFFEDLDTCPENLLLFFHHLPYKYTLKSGKSIIQHIYDTHFEGYREVEELIELWNKVEAYVEETTFNNVADRLSMQLANAKEWRDQINTYFYRKSGIKDEKGRTIY